MRATFTLFALVLFCAGAIRVSGQEEQAGSKGLEAQAPRYEFVVSLSEFSLLNNSIMLGLNKGGGIVEFTLRIGKAGDQIAWQFVTPDPGLMQTLHFWIAEESIEMIGSVDVDELDEGAKVALKAVQTLSAKVNFALENPIWDEVEVSGIVIAEGENWYLENESGKYQMTGEMLDDLKQNAGKSVVAHGFPKVKNQIELTRFVEKKENTLELFVGSHCPYSRRAEMALISYLTTIPEGSRPSVEVHYIFYKQTGEGGDTFTTLHGPDETKENLVQICIRDWHPLLFHDYLLARAESEEPWEELARQVGLQEEDIRKIERAAEEDWSELIGREYAYVVGKYGIYDGSPTYVWEGSRVVDLSQVGVFAKLNPGFLPKEQCSTFSTAGSS